MHVQWYPGHMTKSRRMMEENIALVDIVIELLDARIPYSSKNPDIDALAKGKHRILLLNKADLASDAATAAWETYFRNQGFSVIRLNSLQSNGMEAVTTTARALMQEKIERQKKRGRIFVPIRSMVVGIPNVGKSTFINQYVKKSATKTGDKPGVTRGKQWIRLKKDFELLDTPGILWPKFDDPEVGLRLAFTGAINDHILNVTELAERLLALLAELDPPCLARRYGAVSDASEIPLLNSIALARGFKQKGGEPDLLRTATMVLDEFRGGKLGRLTLEMPPDELNSIK